MAVNILAIETSCDETAVAIVRDGRQVLANSIASQIALHQPLGGVKPELAARQHILAIIPTLEEAMQQAGLEWDSIDAIAVTAGPGLAGALLVGLNAAKAIAFARAKPLIAVNHLEAHIYSNWIIAATLDTTTTPAPEPPPPPRPTGRAGQALRAMGIEPAPPAAAEIPAQRPTAGRPQYAPLAPPPVSGPDLDTVVPSDPTFPLLCLVVSGGHTELILMNGHGHYAMLGKTVDDAAGEAFDKVARILGLPYPGGPAIQQAAATGNPRAIDLPRRTNLRGPYDFSFSGLKTAALRQSQQYGAPITPAEVAAEQAAAEQAAAAERARQEAAARAQREAEEATRRAQREAEEAAQRQAEETARQAVAEERRQAAARRAEEERIRAEEDRIRRAEQERLQIAAERQRLEVERQRLEAARTRAADREPPPQRETPLIRENPPERAPADPPAPAPRSRRPTDAPDRPSLSILGDSRAPAGAVPPPPPNPPRQWGPPARPTDKRAGEAGESAGQPRPRTENTTGQRTSGLIRITPTDSESDAGTGDDAARRASAPTERLTPRVLGKGEHEAIPPPPFLAERGGGTAPTPLPRNRTASSDPDVPDFLRNRSAGTPPAAAPADQGQSAAPPPPRKPPAEATPPPAASRPPQRSLLEDLVDREDAPPTPPIRRSNPPPAGEPSARPVVRPPQPAARNPPPLAKPPPPAREVRAVPKPGGNRADDAEADESAAAADATPQARAGRSRDDLIRDIFADDEDLGSDDDPTPPPRGNRSLGLDSTRPPAARVPVPSSDDPAPDQAATRRARPTPDKPRLPVADFAASFQDAAVEMLVERTVSAAAAYKVRTVLVAGGVAANLRLRERLRERLGPDIQLRYPPPVLCTDNAAMVAAAAYFRYAAGLQSDWTLDIDPNARYVE